MNAYERLLAPGKIGSLSVPNRMICTAMVTQYANEDGTPSEQFIRYHEEKARGGWGLVVTEDYCIVPDGRTFARLPGLWDDSQVAAHAKLCERVHAAGGRLCCQLFHPGRETTRAVTGGDLVAPSTVREPTLPDVPRELSADEIAELVKAFGAAARRAKQAGFDAVEIHGAHGYLVGQFLSPFSNKRTDAYGGTLRHRARFALEIVRAVRSEVGPEFPVLFRLNVDDCVPGGVDVPQACAFARMLEQAGVDLLNCSQGMYASVDKIIPPAAVPRAAFAGNAAAVKQVVGIPVSAVGRINDPDVAEAVLASGAADFVSMGRASLADPHFPRKVAEGRVDDVITCVGCCRGCSGQNNRGECVRCVLNPLTGCEGDYDLRKANRPRRVTVVGGGIAGCEAAIAAAARGHAVTLIECANRLGGQWRLASVPPGKEDYGSFTAWQEHTLDDLGVRVMLGTDADVSRVMSTHPDVAIVATGSSSLYPPIPGLRERECVVDARDVLAGNAALSGRIVVLGGGLVGAETAELLSQQGCEVTIVEMRDELAPDAEPSPRKYLVESLQSHGVRVMLSTKAQSVSEDCVAVEGPECEDAITGVDAVVVALGARPDDRLSEKLQELGVPVTVVGDSHKVRDAFANIREGFEAGLAV